MQLEKSQDSIAKDLKTVI